MKAKTLPGHVRRMHGYYSYTDAQNELNLKRGRLYEWVRRGAIKPPKAKYKGSKRTYFTADDLAAIRKLIREFEG